MSNALTIKIPDSFKVPVPQEFSFLNPDDDKLGDGVGQSYPIINYRGKTWSLRYRGERKYFIRSDDGTNLPYIDVVILGAAGHLAKNYFKKFVEGQESGDRPLCSSMDGVVPDGDVIHKEAEACALCPRNEWKRKENGKQGKECQDHKRVAVMVMPYMTEKMGFGEPVMTPTFLKVPPDSLQALTIMSKTMQQQGRHSSTYVTRISFDPSASHPKMVFQPVQPLTGDQAATIKELCEHADVERIIHGNAGAVGLAAVRSVTPALVIPPSRPAPVVPVAQRQTIEIAALAEELVAEETNVVPFTATTAADTGKVEEADEDLDALIAQTIKDSKK